MEIFEKSRVWIAAVLSPAAVSFCIYVSMFIVMSGEKSGGNEKHIEIIIANIGTAAWVAYFISLIVGLGAYYLLRRKNWYGVRLHLLAGLGCGFVAWIIFSLFSLKAVSLLFFVYLFGGTLMGAVFWLIAYFKPDGNYNFKTRRRRRRTI